MIGVLATSLVALIWLNLACSDDPASPPPGGGSGPDPSTQWTWVEVDTFVEGDRIAAVYGTGPGNIYCATLGIERRSDGWQLFPEGVVVNYNGTTWSPPLYDINATGWDLDLWASSPTDIYLADGRLHHFDGTSWKDAGINAEVVFGTSATDVFAASLVDTGAVYRYDGAQWTELTRLAGDEPFKAIFALPGPFVVVAREHSIAMWDGATWTEKAFLFYEYIEDVWASSPNNVFAVGNGYPEPRAWRFNGNSWLDMAVPDGGSYTAVWGSSPNDVYACGRDGAMIHFNGSTSWRTVPMNTFKSFWDIWGSGPGDFYATGENETVMHFDGTSWESISKQTPDKPGILWAESPDRFALSSGIDAGTVYLYDHGEWTEHYITGNRYSGIRSMAGTSLEDLTVLIDRETWHFDGQRWTREAILNADFPGEMAFPSPGKGFAVGGRSIFQFNGSVWNEVVTGLPWTMMGLWAASENSVYAINKELLVYHYNGQQWQTIPSPVTEGSLIDIWGVSSNEVYVLAGGGLFVWDGNAWTEVPYLSNTATSKLMLSSSDNMFSWGGCWLGHFDGTEWSLDCLPNDSPIQIIQSLDGPLLQLTRRAIMLQVFE